MFSETNRGPRQGVYLRWSLAFIALCAASLAHADARSQAKRIHDRLTGIPPTAADLATMEQMVSSGNAEGAAKFAMTKKEFYNTTLKNWVTPWTNVDANPYLELNDFTATVIGMIRDNVPFDEVLYGNVIYAASSTAANIKDIYGGQVTLPTTAAYSALNNTHYIEIEKRRVDLSLGDPDGPIATRNVAALEKMRQDLLDGKLKTHPELVAGVMTTRAFADAYIKEGTNRRAIRFVFKNFLCRDIEDVTDVTRTPDRIRQDVSRSPGGDSSSFLSQCVGCHAGMDPLAQAFAYYDYQEITKDAGMQLVITPDLVQKKNHINAGNFPLGYFVNDDHWDNYWRKGKNANLGWSSSLPSGGNGIQSLGREIAASKAFATCQVQKAFKLTCLRDPLPSTQDEQTVRSIAATFMNSGYKMKDVLASTAAYCKGD